MPPSPPMDRIAEARLIADYARLTGCLRKHTLFETLAEAEEARGRAEQGDAERRACDQAILRLEKVLHDTASLVPYHTRAKLFKQRDASEVKRGEDRFATALLHKACRIPLVA